MVTLETKHSNDLKVGDKIILFDNVTAVINCQDWGMQDGKLFLQSYGKVESNDFGQLLTSKPGNYQVLVWEAL